MSRWTEQDLTDYQGRRALKIEIVSGPKPSKYRNKKTVVDNIEFASKREATRYQDLKLMQQAGLIHDLELQKQFLLEVNDVKIGSYFADFVYQENGQRVVEDAKGLRTRVYQIKKKLMLALHNVSIRET